MSDASADPLPVVVPAGRPLLDAAAWVGHSCWAELRLHEVLTAWMATEPDAEFAEVLWSLRADAAERAAAWHRHLPELREFPRATFVVAPDDPADAAFEDLTKVQGPQRRAALDAAMRERLDVYEAHQTVAVGPADGPVAVALGAAIDSVRAGLDRA